MMPAIGANMAVKVTSSSSWSLDDALTLAAVASVVFAAIFAEAARHHFSVRAFGLGSVCAAGTAILVFGNFLNAVNVAAVKSTGTSDKRWTAITTTEDREDRRAQLKAQREALAQIAGAVTPDGIEAAVAKHKTTDAFRWQSTRACNAASITSAESRSFCGALADLQAKLAAARERDSIDGQLARLTEQAEKAGPAPRSDDPFADALAPLLGALGFDVVRDPKATRATISTLSNWISALTIEVIAALGPMAARSIFGAGQAGQPSPVRPQHGLGWFRFMRRPAPDPTPAVAVAAEDQADPVSLPLLSPGEVTRQSFLEACVEISGDGTVLASDMHTAYCGWCRANGHEPMSASQFGRGLVWPKKKKVHGVMAYVGVRLVKQPAPAIRLVKSGRTEDDGKTVTPPLATGVA